jgi:Tfp pilus assembly protein PilF
MPSAAAENEESEAIQSMKGFPTQAETYYNKGTALLKGGKVGEAIQCYTLSLDISPEEPLVLCSRAVLQYEKKEYTLALKDLKSAQTLVRNQEERKEWKGLHVFSELHFTFVHQTFQQLIPEIQQILLDMSTQQEKQNMDGCDFSHWFEDMQMQ